MFGTEAPPEAKAGIEDVDLDGRTALVTGSTSGLGREAALALGRLGASVIVHGRNREAGERVVAELETVGADARFVAADFERPAAVSALADAVAEEVDGLDVLCNNAGGLFQDGGEIADGGGAVRHGVGHRELADQVADPFGRRGQRPGELAARHDPGV